MYISTASMNPDLAGGMMADGAVSFLLLKLENLATREWKMQDNIRDGIDNLQMELRHIEALMRDEDARNDRVDHQFQVWIQNVRTQAYEIEDALDLFRALQQLQESSWQHWKMRHSINNLINEIKTKLGRIQETRKRYQMLVSSSSSADQTGTGASDPDGGSSKIPGSRGHLIVGIDVPEGKLVSWAREPNQNLKVMFVVGMAGLGKKTLARSVYNTVWTHFGCHAWIIASKSKTEIEVLQSLLEELGCSKEGSDMVVLIERLQIFLCDKRYVIVVDDLCAKYVWEFIKQILPRCNGSRIIITTRRGDIANSCRSDDDSIDIHMLQPLSPQSAEQLFYSNAFPRNDRCSSNLEDVSKSILQKCDGLPLGIIQIGKALSNKSKTIYEWRKLHDSLQSGLRRDGELSDVMRVLSASYNDLPYHLKPCFLYMSVFPVDFSNNPVQRRRLIRLWIAEGFLKEERGKTLEEVGEEYLNELICRSLIMAKNIDFDERPITVGVHSLMHRMILRVSKEENFCTVCAGAEGNLQEKPRRLSIQTENFDMPQDLTSVRTFFSTGRVNINGFNFKLNLKVLDLQGSSLVDFPSAITELVLLRYLSLRNTQIRSIPKSVGNLRQLQTLDLKQTLVKKLPEAVIQLDKLRHLLVYYYHIPGSVLFFDAVKGFSAPRKMGEMRSLQKLSFVKARGQRRMIQELKNLGELRKLGIVELAKEDGKSLCQSIEKMTNLLSLHVTSLSMKEPLELHEMENPPRLLQRLYLRGPLHKFPMWISSLHDLVRIRLKWTSVSDAPHNPIAALQHLPNLMELQLLDAYTGTQLVFKAEKFQKLKILELEQLKQLRFIIMEDGTLPCLQTSIIRQCKELEQVDIGMGSLPHLSQLLLCDMPERFVAQLRRKGRDQLGHLPHRGLSIHVFQQGRWVEDL